METVVERPAALDVHKEQVTGCVRTPGAEGRRDQHVAEFKTTVQGLLALRDWLKAHGVTQVAMEASGVYWKPPWAILEDEFDCLLVNARHVKQVPGRKTDVSDAAWLCQLLEAGLLERSFVPPKPIRTLRNLTRYRKAQVGELSRLVIGKAQRETRFRCRAVRIDSTVVEADVRYPTDAGLARAGVRTLAREGKRLAARVGGTKGRVRDRSRAAGKRLRAIGRSLRRRTGAAKAEVLALIGETGSLLAASVKEAERSPPRRARGHRRFSARGRSRRGTRRRGSSRARSEWRRWPSAARRSSSRSASAWPESRSAIG